MAEGSRNDSNLNPGGVTYGSNVFTDTDGKMWFTLGPDHLLFGPDPQLGPGMTAPHAFFEAQRRAAVPLSQIEKDPNGFQGTEDPGGPTGNYAVPFDDLQQMMVQYGVQANAPDSAFEKIFPMALTAIAGAGLAGMLPGTTPFWSGGGLINGGGELLSGMDLAGDAGSLFSGNGAFASGAGLSDVAQWASQYPGGLNPDGSLNWDAINQGMSDMQGVTPGTGPDFPYDPTTGLPSDWVPPTNTPTTPTTPPTNPTSVPPPGTPPSESDTGMQNAINELPDTGNWWDSLFPGGLPGGSGGGSGLNDLLRGLIGGAGSYFSSQAMADELARISDRSFAIGEPSRQLLNTSYTDPNFNLWSQPGYAGAFDQAANAATRQWNPAGNPANNPGIAGSIQNQVMQGSYFPALNSYRSGLLGAGSMGLNDSTQAGLAGVNAMGQGYQGIGYGLNTAMGGNNNPFGGGNDPFYQLVKDAVFRRP